MLQSEREEHEVHRRHRRRHRLLRHRVHVPGPQQEEPQGLMSPQAANSPGS